MALTIIMGFSRVGRSVKVDILLLAHRRQARSDLQKDLAQKMQLRARRAQA